MMLISFTKNLLGIENLWSQKWKKQNKEITEDDSRKGQDEIQKITDGYVSQIEEIISIKEKEILEI